VSPTPAPPRRSPSLSIERAGAAPPRVRVATGGEPLSGGVIAAAVGAAAALALSEARGGWLIDLGVSYLAPVAGEDVFAIGRVLRRGREIAYTAVDVRTAAQMPVAAGLVTSCVAALPAGSRWSAPMPIPPAGAVHAVGAPEDAPGDETLATALERAATGAAAALLPAGTAGSVVPLALHLALHAAGRTPLEADAYVVHRRGEIVATRVTLGAGGQVIATGGVTYRLETTGR